MLSQPAADAISNLPQPVNDELSAIPTKYHLSLFESSSQIATSTASMCPNEHIEHIEQHAIPSTFSSSKKTYKL